ncbi:hypothetical protein D3C73_937780 [compost metagenome]
MVGENGNTQTGADVAMIITNGNGWRQFDENLLADHARFILQAPALCQALEDHHEFVTSDPSDRVSGAQDSFQASRHGHEDAVASGMPVTVVDRLETVEVDEHQCHAGAADSRLFQRVGQSLFEHQAVG